MAKVEKKLGAGLFFSASTDSFEKRNTSKGGALPKLVLMRLGPRNARSFSPGLPWCRRNFFWHGVPDVREILHTPEAVASPAAEGGPAGAHGPLEKLFEFCVAT